MFCGGFIYLIIVNKIAVLQRSEPGKDVTYVPFLGVQTQPKHNNTF